MPILDIAKFSGFKEKEVETGSHWTQRGTLEGSSKVWFCKKMRDPEAAKRELLAQEFFRLLIPHQPVTLLAKDKDGSLYVLSEEVNGYHALPTNQANSFTDGTFTGFGEALVNAMFFQEVDLKNGNIGLDNQNRVIKIDGDWCFAEFHKDFNNDSPFKLTPKAIESLPYPMDFPAFEWLDFIQRWKQCPFSSIVPFDLNHSVQFRAEVNQALLKICLLPDTYIEAFADFYLPSESAPFIQLIKDRRNELQQSALQNDSFVNFLQTPAAQNTANAILKQMKSFQVGGMAVINPDLHNRLEIEFGQQGLLATVWPDYHSCYQLIGALEGQVHPMDTPLRQFIQESILRIEKTKNNPHKLQIMKASLESVLNAMNSAEFNAVKHTISSFRSETGFFMDEKADKIERALYNTALDERETVISNPVSNDVQRALAYHRHPFRESAELPDGQIDYDKAATNFKTLKDKFKKTIDQPENQQDGIKPGPNV